MNQLMNKNPELRLGPQHDFAKDYNILTASREDEKNQFHDLKFKTKWFKNFNWVHSFQFSHVILIRTCYHNMS